MYFELYILLCVLPLVAPQRMRAAFTMAAVLPGVIAAGWGALASLGIVEPSLCTPSMSGVGALFSLLFSFVFISVIPSISSLMAQNKRAENAVHYAAVAALFYALQGVLVAQSTFRFLFYWELMGLLLFLLTSYDSRRRRVMHSAVGLLIVMHAAFIILVGAFATIEPGVGVFSENGISIALWVLFVVGFMVKSAIFPFHFWLPRAYCSAPSWVAALMGGAATNIGLYGIIRITSNVGDLTSASLTLIALGGVSALYGAMRLTSGYSLSRTLAYSSIDNIGLALMAIGIGFYGQSTGLDSVAFWGFTGAAMQIIMHAAAKAMLFLSAGNVERSVGTDSTSSLGGLAKKMPLATICFLIGSASVMALIPAGGFWSEFAIFSSLFSAVASGIEPVVGIVAITATALVASITIFAFSKTFSIAFLGTARTVQTDRATERISPGSVWSTILLGVFVLLGGGATLWFVSSFATTIFEVQPLTDSLETAQTIASVSLIAGIFVALTLLLYLLRRLAMRNRTNSIEPTWGCANGATSPDMQYTDESFSAEARTTFSLPGHHNTQNASRKFLPVNVMRRLTGKLALIQTGHTSHYLMHIILFLTLILILTIVGAL